MRVEELVLPLGFGVLGWEVVWGGLLPLRLRCRLAGRQKSYGAFLGNAA